MLKAVIPVAGLGTRMLPATKAIPKEMLPLVDKPLIQYIVDECVSAGIKEIILVTHSSKNAIENHFDTSFELESLLERRVKRQLLEGVRSICPAGTTIMHVRQGQSKGLGHAVMCAHPLIGDNPFVVLLPDVLIDEMANGRPTGNLAGMIARFDATGRSQIMVETVPREDVNKYGIVDCGAAVCPPGSSASISALVEKPSVEDAPSNIAVVGRYLLTPAIWPLLAMTPPGSGDEIQLTDAISLLLEREVVESFGMIGKSHDCGDKLGYLMAFVEYGLRHPSLGAAFTSWMKAINFG
ncbi:UTP--glucose-1-phosphate uridylyltransferase GalU [Acerihabitans sp. KWT182]|uniref:UTP--glucose-1-phosphate uridylyltransferase n=1 Tax=Acerihabitans sp. KWT182 TaxID=3157919 RepID=A0AAU7Q661_9GAMM